MTTIRPSVDAFVGQLAALEFVSVFNPYAQACSDHDKPDAPAIRRRNLSCVIEAAITSGVDSVWIARDLGYRGGRRTGLALTDELHLTAHANLFNLAPLARSTNGPAMAERTAKVIWEAIGAVQRPIFLWNVFPLHPFEKGDPMTNRCHTRAERHACRPLLVWLLEMLKPKTVLAIGRDAQAALTDLDVVARQVRHPSYGGQSEFLDGVRSHYGLTAISEPEMADLF